MNYYGIFGSFTPAEGDLERLKSVLVQAAGVLERNPDCMHYLVSTDEKRVYVYETWTNKEAHEGSLESEEVRALITEAQPLIASMERIAVFELSGGKGAH